MGSGRSDDSPERDRLARLARAAGIVTSFVDTLGRKREAADESVRATLSALGVNPAAPLDRALREIKNARCTSNCEPVHVVWKGQPGRVWLDLPNAEARRPIRCKIRFEEGGEFSWTSRARGRCTRGPSPSSDGQTRVEVLLPKQIPFGTHALTMDVCGIESRTILLSAPARCDGITQRAAGLFIPLHALRSRRNGGVGDFADLRSLTQWAAESGFSFVGTLPILATFLDRPFDPSPYAPVSRLFWNELFIDLESSPDLVNCPAARRLLSSPAVRRELTRLRNTPRVDYRAAYALKRRVLDALAETAFARPKRRAMLERFRRRNPLLDDYALFRGAVEKRGHCPIEWSAGAGRRLRDSRYSRPTDARMHVYAQFLAEEQLAEVFGASTSGCSAYLDFPLGVHGAGFDAWRFRDSFVPGLSVGAPPDPVFAGGQNWGFPPMHPWRTRQDGHAYFRTSLRFLLRHARVLRIDHVMGLHRLYCIPPGGTGLYVTQPHDELYAALCIEAHRAGAIVVGEDLGTVPDVVHRDMKRRGLLGMHVAQFAFRPDRRAACPPPPRDTLACLNTHDTPTFAAYCRGDDIADRRSRKLLDARAAAVERETRRHLCRAVADHLRTLGLIHKTRPTTREVLHALLSFYARGPSRLVIVSLEDLWLETKPQNIPGLLDHKKNWCLKAARSLEQFTNDARLGTFLRDLSACRNGRVSSNRAATPIRLSPRSYFAGGQERP